ncbi:MAG: YjbQ family protein [Acidobacteria bacterium]|nr:YjbQ family protein [Acidobacteriota bacterium]
MKYHWMEKTYHTSGQTDIIDLSADLQHFVRDAGLRQAQLTIMVPGSTAAITTIEYESGVLGDLQRAVERLIPRNIPYEHDQRWGDGNGYSHVRAAILGPSISIPLIDGRLILGTWQQVVCVDFDNRPRRRIVIFHMIGE